MLKRSDIAMDILWPSAGPLVFSAMIFRAPASTFVADVVGISPPGSGLHVTAPEQPHHSVRFVQTDASRKGAGGPDNLGAACDSISGPLTSPVSYAAGNVKWTNTIKRPRRALKSMTTQWVVFTGLKQHGFPAIPRSSICRLPPNRKHRAWSRIKFRSPPR